MKKIKFLSSLLLLTLFIFSACSNDDEILHPEPAPIDTSVISEEFNYSYQFATVLDGQISYVDVGSGDHTFVVLHGNPTSAYLWRNVIPHLERKGRVIVPDLIGHGKSSKPDIDYSFESHYQYLNAFLESRDLGNNIIFLVHDWGSALGFHWMNNHQSQVKGVAFFEAMVASFDTMEEMFGPSSGDPANPGLFDIMTLFRSGDEGDDNPFSAWEAIVRQNRFVEQMLPMMVMTRQLTDKEKSYYQEPFELESSRKPVWKWPREIPIGGKTVDGSSAPNDAIMSYRNWLSNSSIPKLYLYATPGALNLQERDLPWIETLPNIKVVPFGPGLHFLQEDNPHKIGQEFSAWFEESF